jgi:hypothetical protein
LGLAESAMHNLSAPKSMGFCLSAFIDQRSLTGCLSLILTVCESAKSL